ncbi:MAG TPA: hypothetical protein GX505_02520 [Clostridiales bacterium]|nr:hypothetical protein [Clostridiales bacterium]
MPYLLLSVGIILLIYGGYLLKKENDVNRSFQELLDEQNRDKGDYVKLLAANLEVKTRLDSLETRLEYILDRLDQIHKSASIDSDWDTAANQAGTIEAGVLPEKITKTSLNMGRGEVRFIQSLLKK